MATNYPTGLDTFSDKTNAVDNVDASHVNNLQDAVEAIQGELGTDPAGASATVKARLDALDTTVAGKLATSGTAADSAKVGGIAVTGTPTTGQVLKATSGTAATWQAEAGGGAVSSVVGQTGDVTGAHILADAVVTAALAAKAPVASPTFTGNPAGPTASEGDNDTSLATTAFVERATNTTTHQALGTGSGTRAISASGKWVSATLSGNTTFTFPTPATGRAYTFTVEVIQDATGGRTVTWPGSVLWPGGSAPAVSTAANSVSLFQFTSRDAGATWYGSPQSVAPAVNGTPETVNTQATGGASQAIPDPTVATLSLITLTAATCTLTFPSPAAGKSFSLVLKQDATGGRLVTWPTITWVGTSSVAPTLSTSGNKQDAFTFMCLDGATWLGFYGGAS